MLLSINNHTIFIDEEDFGIFSSYNWQVKDHKGYLYLSAPGGILFHRLIMKAHLEDTVDHKNQETLDCRKQNLRLVTKVENGQNSKTRGGTSQYRGVFNRGDKYRAYINYYKQRIYLGSTKDEVVAATRYDLAAIYLYGEFAALNFPGRRDEYLAQLEE